MTSDEYDMFDGAEAIATFTFEAIQCSKTPSRSMRRQQRFARAFEQESVVGVDLGGPDGDFSMRAVLHEDGTLEVQRP